MSDSRELTENKISVWDERAGFARSMSCFDQGRGGLSCFLLRSFLAGRGASRAGFPVKKEKKTQRDTGAGWQRDRNICDLWLSARHLLLYQEQTPLPSCSQCHGWLDWVTATFACHPAINCMRPKLTTRSCYFEPNVPSVEQSRNMQRWPEFPGCLRYFCTYLSYLNCRNSSAYLSISTCAGPLNVARFT